MLRQVWILAVVALFAAPALAQKAAKPAAQPEKECPFGISERDKIVDALKKATCVDAMSTFQACATASGGDIELGDAVIARCEADFATKLNPAQKRAYDAEHKKCDVRWAKQDGTMYRAYEAYCHADTAKKWSVRLSKPAR